MTIETNGGIEARLRDKPTARFTREVRRGTGLSQEIFSEMYSINRSTLESWEQGVREPSVAALKFLALIYQDPILFYTLVEEMHQDSSNVLNVYNLNQKTY